MFESHLARHFMFIIRDISELENLMTDEQKEKAQKDFEKFYPPGTPEIMCTSIGIGEGFLTKVNLEDFD